MEADWDEPSLGLLRRGYDLALQLFADAYRTSRRPFVAHLVGTASTLLAWNQRPALVAAGLLHSAYMLGHFADGQREVTKARRALLIRALGTEAEHLVYDYTLTKNEDQLLQWCQAPDLTAKDRDLATLQLANLYDDCCDGEPLVAPTKHRTLELPWNPEARQAVLRLAQRAVGEVASAAMSQQFTELDSWKLPDCLRIEKRPSRRVIAGIAELRQPAMRRYINRIFQLVRKNRAA